MALTERISRTLSTQAFRVTAMSAAAFLVAATLIVGLLFWQTNTLLTDRVIQALRSEAAEFTLEAKSADADALASKVEARSRSDGTNLYFLAAIDGSKLAGNLDEMPPELRSAPQGGVFRYQRIDAEGELKQHLAVAIPVPIGSDRLLLIGRDIEEQLAYATRIKRSFLWGFGLLSLGALALGLFVGRSMLKRIETINATSRSIMAGDFSRRIPLSGSGDEFDGLSGNLNDMFERIEQLMGGLREVSDNIAHDLKTPLNRLRNSAEAALRDPRGANAYREGLEATIERADDLIKTFNALLLIARLEAGVIEESAEVFDAGALVRDVAELYQPVAEEEGLDLTIEVEDGIVLKANRQLVGQAVANLADNAIKYSARALARPDLTTISIRARATDGMAEISVGDHGPGIAPEDRERALRRFVRLEKSRTKPGTGLGLSLVAAVARLHKGAIRLEDNTPGLRVILRLPLYSGS